MIRSVLSWTRSFVVLAPFVLACSGGQQKSSETPDDVSTTPNESVQSDDANAPKWSAKSSAEPTGNSGLNDNQKEQMEIVLKRGGKKAESCSATVPEGKGGEGEVKVTMDGQKGRVTDVAVGAPWAGTPMEACIKRAWVGEIILPFEGDPLDVPYTIKIPETRTGTSPEDAKKPGKKK